MNWLAHLSHIYTKIYCIYFYDDSDTDIPLKEDYPYPVEFIPIRLIQPAAGIALFRRIIPVNPIVIVFSGIRI
jgi:hypothetical protein